MLRSSMVAGCNYFILWFQDLGNDQAIWVWQPSCEMLGKVGLKRQVQLRRMDTELDIWLMVSNLLVIPSWDDDPYSPFFVWFETTDQIWCAS